MGGRTKKKKCQRTLDMVNTRTGAPPCPPHHHTPHPTYPYRACHPTPHTYHLHALPTPCSVKHTTEHWLPPGRPPPLQQLVVVPHAW